MASARLATLRPRLLASPSRHLSQCATRTTAHTAPRHWSPPSTTYFSTIKSARMASFSNTDTGSKTSDPYVEKNLEKNADLSDKVNDLLAFVDKTKTCMMTTRIASSGLLVSRCMALAAKEGNGVDLIFHANTESGKTDDLESDSKINLAFQNQSGEWASISGNASVITEREMVRKYYSQHLKAWIGDLGDGIHDGGPEDPRVCVIKVKALTAQYAISRRTQVGSLVEMAKGVVTGSAPQVHRLRHLDERELGEWRTDAK